MRRNLRGWIALPWPDRGRVLAMMLVGLPAIHLALRGTGFGRTRGWLERRSAMATPRRASTSDLDAATRLARLAAIAGRRGPIHATCLRQSLLVYWLLRRRGLAPELKIGVQRIPGAMDAHAWVELEGIALPPGPLAHQPFDLDSARG